MLGQISLKLIKKTLLAVACCSAAITFAGPGNPDYRKVPQPTLEEHPGWVDLYRRAFEIAFSKIQQGTPENGFVDYYMDEAFNPNIFQWDTSFMMMFARYGNGELPAIVSLENFYMKQHDDGWMSRELREIDGTSIWPKTEGLKANCAINPPLFSWAEWQDYQVSGDKTRFTKEVNGKPLIDILVSYYDWIKANRRWDNDLYWTTSWANGMDDSARLNPGRKNDVCEHVNGSWVDISAQQALNAYYVAKIAGEIGRKDIQKRFEKEHNTLSKLINKTMWDKKDGFYYDLDKEGKFYKVKTPASLWPLIARVASDQQVKRLVEEHIVNPDVFWTEHHIPTISKDDPTYQADGGYWDGAVWAPTAYETIKGLEARGYLAVARRASMNHIQNIYYVYRNTNTLWENYRPEDQLPGVKARKDFVGWTGVGPIAALIENVMGIQVSAPSDSLAWDLALAEKHGITQLQFGDNEVSLSAQDRVNSAAGAEINVITNSPFALTVKLAGTDYVINVAKGESTYYLGRLDTALVTQDTMHDSLQDVSFGGAGDDAMRYQTFKANVNGKLKGVDLKIQKVGEQEPSDLVVSLYDVVKGRPVGEAIATTTVAAKKIDNFISIVQADLTYDRLTKGGDYAVVVTQTELSENKYAWVAGKEVSKEGVFGKGKHTWVDESATGDAWMKVYLQDADQAVTDNDGDGVPDQFDNCANTRAQRTVLLNGCEYKG